MAEDTRQLAAALRGRNRPDRVGVLDEYPGLSRYGVQVKRSLDGLDHRGQPYSGRKMEFYPPDEAYNYSPGKPSVEIFDGDMSNKDVMGEIYSHHLPKIDPEFKQGRQQFMESITPEQDDQWLRGDYNYQKEGGLVNSTYDDWKANQGGDGFFRGYVTGQYPEEAYTDAQKKILADLLRRIK